MICNILNKYENREIIEKSLKLVKEIKTGPRLARTDDLEGNPGTGSALTTRPSVIWCWESRNQFNMSDHVSWI